MESDSPERYLVLGKSVAGSLAFFWVDAAPAEVGKPSKLTGQLS